MQKAIAELQSHNILEHTVIIILQYLKENYTTSNKNYLSCLTRCCMRKSRVPRVSSKILSGPVFTKKHYFNKNNESRKVAR